MALAVSLNSGALILGVASIIEVVSDGGTGSTVTIVNPNPTGAVPKTVAVTEDPATVLAAMNA